MAILPIKVRMAIPNLYMLCPVVTISMTTLGRIVVNIGISVLTNILRTHQHKSGKWHLAVLLIQYIIFRMKEYRVRFNSSFKTLLDLFIYNIPPLAHTLTQETAQQKIRALNASASARIANHARASFKTLQNMPLMQALKIPK